MPINDEKGTFSDQEVFAEIADLLKSAEKAVSKAILLSDDLQSDDLGRSLRWTYHTIAESSRKTFDVSVDFAWDALPEDQQQLF